MNLLGTARATQDTTFQARVRTAMVLTALAISHSNLPQGHPRDLTALDVLQNPESNYSMTRFLWLTASDPTIADTVDKDGIVAAPDSAVYDAVTKVWDTLFPETEEPAVS